MSVRELVVLGTSSQVPTRARAHHGAVLRWDDEVVLLDPGEGTQRQLTLAGVSAASISRICITHLHGDHCLGLPGVLQRMSLDAVDRPVDLYFPAEGQVYVDRLRHASAAFDTVEVREHPVTGPGHVDTWPGLSLHAAALDHRIPTYGWRLQEPDGRRMLPQALEEYGVRGPDVGRLQRDGVVEVAGGRGDDGRGDDGRGADGRGAGGRVTLEQVSEPRPGQVFAFVMDTRRCAAAVDLARDADLLVTESTYLDDEADLAAEYAHLTAADAGRIAAEAGARRLVLTHYSQRHTDEQAFADEARRFFPDVHAARDLDRVPAPPRRPVLNARAEPADPS